MDDFWRIKNRGTCVYKGKIHINQAINYFYSTVSQIVQTAKLLNKKCYPYNVTKQTYMQTAPRFLTFLIPSKISYGKILCYYTIRWQNRRLCLSFLTSSLRPWPSNAEISDVCLFVLYLLVDDCLLPPATNLRIICNMRPLQTIKRHLSRPPLFHWFNFSQFRNLFMTPGFLLYFHNSVCPFVRPSWHFCSPIDFPPFFLSTDHVFLFLQIFSSPSFSVFLLRWLNIFHILPPIFFLSKCFAHFLLRSSSHSHSLHIPDICHGRHGHSRVKNFWPV